MQLEAWTEAKEMIEAGALVVVNHSGGKDSQAMTAELRKVVPEKQLLVIHADLPEVDWPGCWEHLRATTPGLTSVQVRAKKTFFQMVERRQMWPSSCNRQCTSDLKRDPIEKAVRQWIKEKGLSGLVINACGIRAEESPKRSKATPWKWNKRNSKAGRRWYDWLPVFRFSTEDVWESIRAAGQEPHYAYGLGNTRLSCVFCIMANKNDLNVGRKHFPQLFRRYVETEKRINHSMHTKTRKENGKKIVEKIYLEEYLAEEGRGS